MDGLTNRVVGRVAVWAAGRQLGRFWKMVHQGPAQQERFLLDHLRRHADSQFGKDHGFAAVRCYRDFAKSVPITTYEGLAPYVDKVKAGDARALLGSSERLVMFAKSSGTTGQAKYIPVTRRFVKGYRYGWNVFGLRSLLDHPGSMFGHVVQVASSDREEFTPTGVPCGAISGLLARTQKWIVRRHYPAPLEVMHVSDTAAKYYAIMRCALARRVTLAVTASPATLLGLFRLAEDHREGLLRDIRDGTVSADFGIPDPLRARIADRYPPDRETARRLEGLADQHGRFRPRDYWDLKWVGCWIGGTLGLYLPRLRDYIGDAPVRDIGLLASEGRLTIPLHDERPEGILDISQNFLEFIPEAEHEGDRPVVLRPHELQIGSVYYVVLTNHAGLCRYDIGDRVRVIRFVGPTPVLEFLSKGAHVSSLTGEKLTEHQVVMAMQAARKRLGLHVESFVLAPRWGDPPYYMLHVEPGPSGPPDLVGLAAELDRDLIELNIEYDSKRKSGRLGPPQTNLVPHGYFARLDARLIAERRGRAEQYKHKYLYSRPDEDRDFPGAATSGPSLGDTGLPTGAEGGDS